MAFVAFLSYSLRKQPSEFHESKWLGLIGMNVASVGSVVGAVYFWMATQLSYSSLIMLQSVGTFIVCTIAVMLIILPKMKRIMKGDKKVNTKKVVKRSVSMSALKKNKLGERSTFSGKSTTASMFSNPMQKGGEEAVLDTSEIKSWTCKLPPKGGD